MKQVTRKLLVLISMLLVLATVFSACGLDSSETNNVSDEAREAWINDLIGDSELLYTPLREENPNYPKVSRTEGAMAGLTDMSLVFSNSKYELYIDYLTTDIAVVDKETKFVYHSNPNRDPSVTLSSSQLGSIASPLTLEAFDSSSKRYAFDFYNNCYEDGSFYIVKTSDQSLRIIYTIGNDPDKNLFPPVITQDTWDNKIIKSLDDLYLDGNITESEYTSYRRLLENCYRYMTPNDITLEVKERFKTTFPTIDVMTLYVSYEKTSSKQKKQIKEMMEKIGFTVKDVKREMEKADYQGPERSVLYTIPVDLTLSESGLTVDIDSAKILGPTKQRLYSIGIYRGMGATSALFGNEYLLVPDGSGAVMNATGGISSDAYKARVFGADNTFSRKVSLDYSQPALAGYLIYDRSVRPENVSTLNAGGMIALIEEGAGQASAVARPISGTANPVCSAYYEVIYSERDYRTYSTSSGGTGDATGSGLLLSKDDVSGNFRIQYLFTKGGLTYSEYAALLRDYYIGKGVLPSETVEKQELPFYVDLLGTVNLERRIAGIPVSSKVALTSYADAQKILSELKDAGISNVVARYSYWANGGEQNTAANDLDLISVMGSRSELNALVQYCSENQLSFYPSVDFLHVTETGNGFSKSQDAARRMNRSTAMISPRYPTTGEQNTDLSKFLVSSRFSVEMAENYKASFENVISTKQIALGDIGSELHSSYKANDNVTRVWAEKDHVKVMETYSDYDIMVSGGNSYTWKYASHIFDLPVGSSEYLSEVSSVPFAQLLLHGYVNYSMAPLNLSGDYETALLLALETGSGFSFRWMAEDDSIFYNTDYKDFYSLCYTDTFDRAVSIYKEAASVLNDVTDKPITEHRAMDAYYCLDLKGKIGYLTPDDPGYVEGQNTPEAIRRECGGVFATVYGNSKVVVVNYNANDAELNDRTVIKGKSYQVFTVSQYQDILEGSAYEDLPEIPVVDDNGELENNESQEG